MTVVSIMLLEMTVAALWTSLAETHAMLNGTGSITLRGGRNLSVKYQFSMHREHHWVGYLIVDSEYIDHSEFYYKVLLHCDGGIAVELAVTNWTNQYMAVVGRPLPEFDQAS